MQTSLCYTSPQNVCGFTQTECFDVNLTNYKAHIINWIITNYKEVFNQLMKWFK